MIVKPSAPTAFSKRKLRPVLIVLAAVLSMAVGPIDEVTWDTSVSSEVKAGGAFTLVFRAEIAEGWYVYALDSPAGKPLAINFDDLPDGISVGSPRQAGVTDSYDPNFQSAIRTFEGNAEISIPGVVSPDVSAGEYALTGNLDYQYCNDRVCIPTIEPFSFSLVVAEGDGVSAATLPPPVVGEDPGERDARGGGMEADEAPPVQPQSDVSPSSDLDVARSGGLLAFLLLAMGAGLASLLTPCVLPMIPLTVSFFSNQASSRSQAIRMAVAYGLSIVIIFTGLGALMAAVAGAAGAQLIASNPWINLFIGLVFVMFALSLLGLFELRLPYRFVNFVNDRGSHKGGLIGVLFMGMTLTLVSFSCTAPFVGGLLAATAMNEWTWPVAGMLVFSITFATPFVLFAMFPKWLGSLPQAGLWMISLKVTLGFVELAAAFKFISNADLVWGWGIVSRTLVISAWIVLFFLCGVYLLGKLRLAGEPPLESVGTGRLLAAITFFGFSLYLFPGLLGAPLHSLDAYLPPRQATDVSLFSAAGSLSTTAGVLDDLDWHGTDKASYEVVRTTAFEQASAQGKPIFIDFTGYTCTNCRQMEANVFSKELISRRLKESFVLMRLYTDDPVDGRELQRYQLQLTGTVALPTYAVVDTRGHLLHRWLGVASTEEFTSFLDEAADRFALGRPIDDLTASR